MPIQLNATAGEDSLQMAQIKTPSLYVQPATLKKSSTYRPVRRNNKSRQRLNQNQTMPPLDFDRDLTPEPINTQFDACQTLESIQSPADMLAVSQ